MKFSCVYLLVCDIPQFQHLLPSHDGHWEQKDTTLGIPLGTNQDA